MAAHPGKCYAGTNCVLCQTLRARERGAKTKRTAPQLATRTTKSTSKRSGTSCGSLSDAEYRQLMRQLQRREELTPDDYELLLRLDEAVPKRDVLPNERVSAVVKQRDVEVIATPSTDGERVRLNFWSQLLVISDEDRVLD